MKDKDSIFDSIERFQLGFWKKEKVKRPPVGIAPDRAWLPINYLKKPFSSSEVVVSDLKSELIRTDYEDNGANRTIISDDWIPYLAAWRAIPWLEAMCGCSVHYSSGSLAAQQFLQSVDELSEISIPQENQWFECLRLQTLDLVKELPADCWISPSILRGPSDVIAAMRGLSNFYLDLYDNPNLVADTASRINMLHIDVLKEHFSIVEPKFGGYGNIYGYWAPGKTTVIQEDAMGMCAPGIYRDIFMPYNAQIVQYLGSYVLFHLHSTGYKHYKHVLDISGLAGLEFTLESNGPALVDLVPLLQEVLDHSRLILFVDSYFEQLQAVLKKLPKEGLYLIISDKFITTELEFQEFLAAVW